MGSELAGDRQLFFVQEGVISRFEQQFLTKAILNLRAYILPNLDGKKAMAFVEIASRVNYGFAQGVGP